MRKALFLTYYWPPSGKASVHWPLHIIKHLPNSGWEPIVLTAKEDTFNQRDDSIAAEVPADLKVYKAKSFEPFDIYRKFTGKGANEALVASETISLENKSLPHRISIWIRMNLFIPDARIGWYPRAVMRGSEIYGEHKFDAIVSVGPPHSVHLVVKTLAKKFDVPFIPVFIDPWTDIAYYRGFKRSFLTLKIDYALERTVLKNCYKALFVTKAMKEDYLKRYDFLNGKSEVLYWGYSEENFTGLDKAGGERGKILLHAGNIFDYQNSEKLWKEIKKRNDAGEGIRIRFIGTVSPGIRKSISENGLEPVTEFKGFLTYREALREMLSASYLLVCATESRHLPGKLFEYLRAGVPILAYGNDNPEIEELLKKSGSGMLLRYDDDPSVFFDSVPSFRLDNSVIKEYDRSRIAEKLGKFLNDAF